MDPFNKTLIDKIFEKSPAGYLLTRESNSIEFKESFSLASLDDYAKDMAAFSNNKGGYLVFGIKNSPHIPVGLLSTGFNQLDPSKFTEGLNSIFSPSINWEKYVLENKEGGGLV